MVFVKNTVTVGMFVRKDGKNYIVSGLNLSKIRSGSRKKWMLRSKEFKAGTDDKHDFIFLSDKDCLEGAADYMFWRRVIKLPEPDPVKVSVPPYLAIRPRFRLAPHATQRRAFRC